MTRRPYCFSQKIQQPAAFYSGIEVEVLAKMDHCGLIHYGDLKVVVDTQDLVFQEVRAAAA